LINSGPTTNAIINNVPVKYSVDGGPNTWFYDGNDVTTVLETTLVSTNTDVNIEVSLLNFDQSTLSGVRGIIARSALAKKLLDEDWSTPGSGSVSSGNLSISATSGETLAYLAGTNLNDWLAFAKNIKTQFTYTLKEMQEQFPYILPPNALIQLYSDERQENILCGTQDCYNSQGLDYIRMRYEGYQPCPNEDGAIPLNNYWNGHDNYDTTLSRPPPPYDFSNFNDGYILSKSKPGLTTPVYVYYNEKRGDMLTVASQDGVNYAQSNNYKLYNDTIGHVYINPTSCPMEDETSKDKALTDKMKRWSMAWALLQGIGK